MSNQSFGRAWIGLSFARGTAELWQSKQAVQDWMNENLLRRCRVRANVYGRFDMIVGAEWTGSASDGIEKALSELSSGTKQNFEFQSQTYFVIKDMLIGTELGHGRPGIPPSVKQRLSDPNPWQQLNSDGSSDDKHCIVVGIRANPNSIPTCAEQIQAGLARLAPNQLYTLDQVTGDLDLILTMAIDPDRGLRIEATPIPSGQKPRRPESLFDVLRSNSSILATETFIGHGMIG